MMYSEFLKGTGAPENKETYEQFQVIEKIYMDCCQMTKQEAYNIWKKTYGKEIKLKRKKMLDRVDSLLCSVERFERLPEVDQNKILKELSKMYYNAWYNRDDSKCSISPERRTFTDAYGIVWFVKGVSTFSNGTVRYGLFAYVDGRTIDAHYVGI